MANIEKELKKSIFGVKTWQVLTAIVIIMWYLCCQGYLCGVMGDCIPAKECHLSMNTGECAGTCPYGDTCAKHNINGEDWCLCSDNGGGQECWECDLSSPPDCNGDCPPQYECMEIYGIQGNKVCRCVPIELPI